MKSNKQRRAEITKLRLARARRAATLPSEMSHQQLRAMGAEPADPSLLARFNPNHFEPLPTHYIDRAFRCHDCHLDCVWTAKQQKWWFETMGASLHSRAKRCLSCRRKRRAELAKARSAPGANLLGEKTAWLREAALRAPDAATEAQVEAALASRWSSVRSVAAQTVCHWARAHDKKRFMHWALNPEREWPSKVRAAAAQALTPMLTHANDDIWVLNAYADIGYAWPWTSFIATMDTRVLNDFFRDALRQRPQRAAYRLCEMLIAAHRTPSADVCHALLNHPDRHIRALVAHAGWGETKGLTE